MSRIPLQALLQLLQYTPRENPCDPCCLLQHFIAPYTILQDNLVIFQIFRDPWIPRECLGFSETFGILTLRGFEVSFEAIFGFKANDILEDTYVFGFWTQL